MVLKKLLSMIIAFAMLLATAPSGFVFAEGSVAVAADTVTAAPGDTGVEVYVRMGAEPHWAGVDMSFAFDSSKLTYKGFRRNPAIEAQAAAGETMIYTINTDSAAAGSVSVHFAAVGSAGGYFGYFPDGYDYFGVLTFDVAPSAAEGLAEVSVNVSSLTDFEASDVPFTQTSGGVNVTACEHEWAVTAHAEMDCENAGFTDSVCTKCGAEKHETVPARGHLWNEIARVEPTAEAEGSVTYECVWCGATRTEILEVLPPFDGVRVRVEKVAADPDAKNVEVKLYVTDTPHWSSIDVELNFDPAVLTFRSFALNPELQDQSNNGEANIYTLNKTNAANGVVKVLFAAAYFADGYDGYHSGGYDYFGTAKFNVAADAPVGLSDITASINKLTNSDSVQLPLEIVNGGVKVACVHEWTEVGREEHCLDAGYVVCQCSKCGEYKREDIAAAGHNWGAWEETTPATCTEAAVETRACTRCGETETREGAAASGHYWIESGRTPATCSAEGAVHYVCLNNPDHEKTEPIPLDPEAHAWGEWEITFPATCETAAVETRVCANDASHTETREGQAALGHDFGDWTETKAPSCTEAGEETRYCSRCDAFETRAVGALGHDWGEWEVTVPATCAAVGTETRVCKRDPLHTEARKLAVDPEAHAWGEWEVTSPATCETAAVETRVCANDPAHTETREGEAAFGHAWGEWTVTRTQTFYRVGEETRVCANDPSHFETRDIPRYLKGDMDFDGEVTVADALTVLRIAAQLAEQTELSLAVADTDRDDEISVADALQVLRRSVKLISAEEWERAE